MNSNNFASPKNTDLVSGDDQQQLIALLGKRVVIVEDEGMLQLQLRMMLRSEGMDVVGTAADGKTAIEVVLATRPDVVLMDINMPVMNGLEASEHILTEFSVCIVMLTAFCEEEFQMKAKHIGTCGYIIKPVTRETLLPQLLSAFQGFRRSE